MLPEELHSPLTALAPVSQTASKSGCIGKTTVFLAERCCLKQDLLPPEVPIISVSKGLELGTGSMMSELIPQALGRRQPAAFISGPSFAKEVMDKQPTGFVAASKVLPMCLVPAWAHMETGGIAEQQELHSHILLPSLVFHNSSSLQP